MPELPEVETVKRGLNRLIIGRKIKKVVHDNQKSFPNSKIDVDNFLIGASIVDVRRRGKALVIKLSSGYSLVIHLKMTGQIVFVPVIDSDSRFAAGHPNDSMVGNLPDKSTRVTITFEDGSRLFFNDQRKFGWMRLIPDEEVNQLKFMQKLGPEPLEDRFSKADFIERFRPKVRSKIKAALLDQTVIAGVGNIYADEALWGAKIHPETTVGNISDKQLEKLYEEVRFVMNLSIDKGGSTNRNYVNAEGKKGSYMDFARVFRREGQLCPRCDHEIIKIRVAGRGTHLCPICQKID